MQSIPRIVNGSCKQLIVKKTQKGQSISVIPKISSPNQILPQQLLLSKPVSHLFVHNFDDVQSESGSVQPLYDPSLNQLSPKNEGFVFSLYESESKKQSPNSKTRVKINKLHNLRDFFLEDAQNLVFLSRSACLSMNQTEKLLYRKLLSIQGQNLTQSKPATEKYIESLKRLSKNLLEKQKFPFLCPQLNQTITENSSLNNALFNSKQDDYLSFNDNFQCSNILMAKIYKQSENKEPFHCICTRFDYQTASYGQWFYFSVKRNCKSVDLKSQQKKKFKFIICNMTKRHSMLGVQMKISICRNGVWSKQGEKIHYYETSFKRGNKNVDLESMSPNQQQKFRKNHQLYFALQFNLQLSENEEIFVSYNEPYSMSRLSELLDSFTKVFNSHLNVSNLDSTCVNTSSLESNIKSQDLSSHSAKKRPAVFFKRQIVCETPLENQIQCLTFSMKKVSFSKNMFEDDENNIYNNENDQRQVIILMARAHPIQTAGSFVLEGFLKNLFLYLEYMNDPKRKQQLKEYFEAERKGALLENLLKNFIIKVIPMINPDGVILGNSRCNFHGLDLNRQWKRSNKNFSQQVYCLKRFLLKFKDRIEMVIDLHGHSKERNVFAYGMHDFKNPFSTRQFPYILSKLTQKNFLFDQCKFTRVSQLKPRTDSSDKVKVKENVKEGTARIWLFRKLEIPNIFTIQNSYCGSIHSKFHYDRASYGQIGKQILLGISLYFVNFSSTLHKKEQNQTKNRKKQLLVKKEFKQDQTFEEFESKILMIDELKSFKDSIILDLQLRQQNATIGIDDINSSESQDARRLEDELLEEPRTPIKRQKLTSPSKSRSHHVIKKGFQQKMIPTPIKSNRYPTHEMEEQKPYNFKIKLQKPQQSIQQSDETTDHVVHSSRINLTQKSRYLSSDIKQKLRQMSLGQRSPTNHKSTIELQKNVTLSIVQLGWDNSKLIEQNKCQTQRPNFSGNGLFNFPQISLGNPLILPPHSNLSLHDRINEKIHHKLVFSAQNADSKVDRKSSQSSLTGEMFQKIQQKKNVAEFMKKIQSNRKLQNQIVTSRKIQKYKQIIMKINGGKS